MARELDHTPPVARYKALLRTYIDLRPSGLRGRLAEALGKHKSFISQITNPSYAVPIPAADLPTIFQICHLSREEQESFLELYAEAHPERLKRSKRLVKTPHEVRIALPSFQSADTAREVEALITDFASRVIRLARHAETRRHGGDDDARPSG
ncbi:MAG: hypothetical protein ACFB3T_02890 [Geminicoccaceae bacterium]